MKPNALLVGGDGLANVLLGALDGHAHVELFGLLVQLIGKLRPVPAGLLQSLIVACRHRVNVIHPTLLRGGSLGLLPGFGRIERSAEGSYLPTLRLAVAVRLVVAGFGLAVAVLPNPL